MNTQQITTDCNYVLRNLQFGTTANVLTSAITTWSFSIVCNPLNQVRIDKNCGMITNYFGEMSYWAIQYGWLNNGVRIRG